MEIGLYNMKYPVRRMIAGVLPLVRHVEPNTISWCMLPVGLATAVTYYVGAAWHRPWLYLFGIALIFLRMFLGTLDGLAAVHYGKGTLRGELINRLAPELCDAMYLTAIAAARPEWRIPGIGALALGWLTSFSGMLGAVIGTPTQSVGPVGQTDRLASLQILSLAALLSDRFGWGIDCLLLFLSWCVIGGIVTVTLRLCRHFQSAGPAATPPS